MRRLLALLATTLLVLAGCGDDDGGDAVSSDGTTSTAAPDPDGDGTSTTTTDPDGADGGSGDDQGDPAPDPADLPGEVFDLFPYEGADLAVVGVERDDTLNFRAGPGVNFLSLRDLSPTAAGIIATGHNRMVDDAIWVEAEVDGETGWVNSRYVLQLGATFDVTSELGERPTGETMVDLGLAVGQLRASEEPPSRVVIISDPVEGDLGEIWVDVIGLGDDAQGGERLMVLGAPAESGEGFVLRTVESVILCSRGVTDDGACL